MKKILALLLCALLTLALVPFAALPAFADEPLTVVYVKTGGTGDGTSAESPVGMISKAYDKLDLTKDCTVVVCGALDIAGTFVRSASYTGSVTITSTYGGVDYAATAGAQINAPKARFVCYGDTTFENVKIKMNGDFWLVVAQDYHLVVGNGVTVETTKEATTGKGIAAAFSILAGYQSTEYLGKDNAVSAGNAKVEVYSGEKILIVAGNRLTAGSVRSGAVDVTVGGTAQVGAIYLTSVNKQNMKDGDITVTVKDSANVELVGAALDKGSVANSLTVNWLGGTIGDLRLINGYNIATFPGSNPENYTHESVLTTYTNGTKLIYNDATEAAANFTTVSGLFDAKEKAGSAKIEVPTRPTLENTTDKTYLAYDIPAGLGDDIKALHVKDSKNHGYYDLASAALTSGGTIVVTQKALFSFSMSDTRNTIDGTKGTVLVTAQDGETNYINTATDTKETGILLGNNNFKEANWSKVDYLRVAGDVIFDHIVFFNRAHKNADGNLAPMDEPNTVLALAGSRVVIGSGAQFLSREKSGDTPLNLPNMALATEEGSVVFLDTLGFSKYTGKGTIIVSEDVIPDITPDTFAGFEGIVADKEGNVLFGTAPANPTPTPTPTPAPATGSATVVAAACAILASFGAIVALKKREER